MNLTPTELIEPLILALMGVYAWYSPIRWQALWSCLGFALFLAGCHYALGVWQDGPSALLFAGIAAHIFAVGHLKFHYDGYGLFIGWCFVAIGMIGGLAALEAAPITVDQGPGLDAWTAISVLLYLSWGAFLKGVHNARKVSNLSHN